MPIDALKLFTELYSGRKEDIQIRDMVRQRDGTELLLADALERALGTLGPELADIIRTRFEETPLLEAALAKLRNPATELRQFCIVHR
jgi:hypothetical protein